MVRSTSRPSFRREERDYFTLREVLHVLWGRRVLVLVTVAIFVLASLVFSAFRDTVYKAEAVVRIVPQEELSSGQDTETFVDGVFRSVDSQDLWSETMRRAGWQAGQREFEERREVHTFNRRGGEEAGLLIQFSDSNAEVAARGANTYAALFVRRVGQLSGRLAGGSLAATADLQSRAAVPEHPSSPRPLIYALLAAAAGILVGGAVALALESRTQSWRGARDAEMTLRAPVLGVIPDYSPHEEDS